MAVTITELNGKAVVSIADGEKVGRVEDMLIDTAQLRATTYVLKGDHGHGLLPFELVKTIGPDAITIDNSQVINWITDHSSSAGGKEASQVLKLTVVDDSGTIIGDVHDVQIDTTTGQILQIDTRTGGVFGLGAHAAQIPIARVRSIGRELITVDRAPTNPPK